MNNFEEGPPESDRSEDGRIHEAEESLARVRREVDDLLDWEITPDGITLDLQDMEKAWDSIKEIIHSVVEFAISPLVDLLPELPDKVPDLPPIIDPDSDESGIVEAPIFKDAVVIGNPEALEEHWRWQGPTQDCALYAQGQILEALGFKFDIESFRNQGIEGGWYTIEEGTDADSLGLLLQNYGVEYSEYASFEADTNTLIQSLREGKGVVVGIETSPITGVPGGHAVMVTGVELDQDGKLLSVICNDSGFKEGRGHRYPADRFVRAWANQKNMMIVTNKPIVTLPEGLKK